MRTSDETPFGNSNRKARLITSPKAITVQTSHNGGGEKSFVKQISFFFFSFKFFY